MNNLLARFQRMNQEITEAHKAVHEFNRIRNALSQALYRVKVAKTGRRLEPFPRIGTMVDTLIENIDSLLPRDSSNDQH